MRSSASPHTRSRTQDGLAADELRVPGVASATEKPQALRVESQQLGTLDVPRAALIDLPQGMIGFPSHTSYCLLNVGKASRFQLLQSTERPDLAFVVIDPLCIDPLYSLDLLRRAVGAAIPADEALGVACVVTVPAPPRKPTVNFLAPLVIGAETRIGLQVVLNGSSYAVRHEL